MLSWHLLCAKLLWAAEKVESRERDCRRGQETARPAERAWGQESSNGGQGLAPREALPQCLEQGR